MRSRPVGLALALALALTGLGSRAEAQWRASPRAAAPDFAAAWKQVEKLAHQERLEAAATEVEKIRERARQAGDEDNWTRALVREVRFRVALGGYETAVGLLKEQPWPKGRLSHAVLQLYYAQTLVIYDERNAWEIGRRERVSGTPTDLRAWTSDQIRDAAIAAYADVWKDREALGGKPVATFAGYLQANNYPAEVRGTLRDAVSYLFVELLANTRGWRPEQSSESDALDFPALLAGDAAKSGRLKLDDPSVHPLLRVGAVLDDLERWHQARGEREAVLEARLTRARTLFAQFDDTVRRDQLLNDLTARLAAFKDRPWSAMGQAELATLLPQRGGSDALVKARALAAAGAKAYPASLGGKRCQAIVAGIDAPTYSLESMKSDGLGRRSLLVTHKNLGELHFRAYPVDLEKQLATSREYEILPGVSAMKRRLSEAPVAAWTVALPATPDFRQHYTYVTPPLDKPGLYSIVASQRKDFAPTKNRIAGAPFIATNLVIVTQQSRGTDGATNEVRVLEGDTGKAAAGVEVRIYRPNYEKEAALVSTTRTDANGLVRIAPRSQTHIVLAKRGRNYALDENGFYLGAGDTTNRETTDAFVYTDRSIYRPLQKLFFKAVVFRGRAAAARYNVVAGQSLTVTLRDGNYQEVDKRTLTTNAYGSVAGEFTLPAGRLLGRWSVSTSVGGQAGVQVEEYKRPTFEVKIDDPKSALRLDKPGDLTGSARTYFGLPVVGGQLHWRVAREPVYPDWWGWLWARSSWDTREETIAAGAVALDAAGAFHFSFVPRAPAGASARGQQADAITYNYRVVAEITAEGGETRSAERTFRLGLIGVEARLTGNGLLREGVAGELTAMRADLDGVPRSGRARWRLVSLAQPKAPVLASERAAPRAGPDAGFETPGDRLRPRWEKDPSPEEAMRDWADGAEKAAGALVHDAKGRATIALPALPAGAYRIHYETQDDFGARYHTQREVVVAGARTPLALPAVLVAEQSTVNVGKTARLLAASGFADQTLFVETWRAGKKVTERVLVAGRDAALIEIPIKEEDRGGLSVTLTALRDHQLITASVRLTVPWDDRQLDVKLSSFRDKLRPGGKETWKVTVKGPAAAKPEAAAAELVAYMYDRTLDALAPHTPPKPMSLWPDRSESPTVQASLGQSYALEISVQREPSPGVSLRGDRLELDRRFFIAGVAGLANLRSGEGDADEDGCPDGGCAEAKPLGGFAMTVTSKPREGEEKTKLENKDKSLGNISLIPERLRSGRGPSRQIEVRANFAETAFWRPQLLTGADGSATIEFTVPDSVTSWNVWVHALTKDLASGSALKQVESLKELMVRPSLPRFLREGDRAELQVTVNNAGERDLAGELRLAVADPATGRDMAADFGIAPRDLARPFKVAKGAGVQVTFPLAAPRKVGLASFTVTAAAGDLSDGERRPLPVLPSRVHLVQSKFVTLKDSDRREMTFPDMSAADPTRVNDQLVVTVDAQLFNTVLRALPYLRRYPYECTEQTLNRFVSAGIVTSAFRQVPAIANLAKQASARTTPLEPFDAADANRTMALEETPWLVEAKGGPPRADEKDEIVDILDPAVAAAERQAALVKLVKAQTSAGGFPWFPGGPPDPYMTLYIMEGFARASEFKVPVPKEVVQRGWQYLARHFRSDYMGHLKKGDCCWEWLTFLNYVAGSYPDPRWVDGALSADERREILEFSFRHWRKHSPYLKGLLALSLHRAGRSKDARLVWASVMDAAKTRPDEGTFFAAEERSWLWYEDTIETHAFALRTLMELDPRSDKKDGLVLWLLRQKKLGPWKSTRATAEVIYALVHYLKKEGTLGIRENARVTIAGKTTEMVFEPGALTGNKNQVVVPGQGLGKDTARIGVAKDAKGFALASATWHFSTEKLPRQEHGDFFSVSRRYFRRDGAGKQVTLTPIGEGTPLRPGDELEVQLSLRTKHEAEYVHLRDPRGAGFEPSSTTSGHHYDLGISWYEEIRDSGVNFFFDRLPAGEYTFTYRVRATTAGTYRVGPATVQSIYAPEFNAYSAGTELRIASRTRPE